MVVGSLQCPVPINDARPLSEHTQYRAPIGVVPIVGAQEWFPCYNKHGTRNQRIIAHSCGSFSHHQSTVLPVLRLEYPLSDGRSTMEECTYNLPVLRAFLIRVCTCCCLLCYVKYLGLNNICVRKSGKKNFRTHRQTRGIEFNH
jgi:hypothetical protein